MPEPNFPPTDEQLAAIRAFRTNENLRINAFAGTGKTTTLMLLAKETRRQGMYLAFNKSIASEAQTKFGSNVTCSTVHSLAYRGTPSDFKKADKMTGRVNANSLVHQLQIEDEVFAGNKLTARSQGHLTLGTLRRFMQGDRAAIQPTDVPVVGKMKMMSDADLQELVRLTGDRASNIWERMRDPRDALPLGHDGYLKLWALGRPRFATDFIMLDEAQDTNPVVLGVLREQPCQMVYVGDRHQQIYEWRGAINAMEQIATPQETYLTTSFRFGPEIAAAATNVLRHLGEQHPLRGNPERKSYLAADGCSAILARTNASVIATVISKMAEGYSVYVVGGVTEIVRMLYGVRDLKQGRPSDHPDLFGFKHWNEVVEFSKSDEGDDIRTFVGLVEQYGEGRLIATLKDTEHSEGDADLIISTAHKAKGREWDSVELVDDFLKSRKTDDGEPKPLDPAEVRLFYVALTRGQQAVKVAPAVLSMFDIAPTLPRPGGQSIRPSRAPYVAPIPSSRRSTTRTTSSRNRRQSPAPVAEANLLERYWWWVLLLAGGLYWLMA